MRKNYLILLLFIFTNNVFSSDTTIVRIHDHTDMTWYGNYDEWGVLPDDSLDYRKIYLHYTMGCATGGCSDWDYTTQIFVRHRTGEIDSTLESSPTFTVNGIVIDSTMFSSDTTYIHIWDSTNNILDSTISNLLEIIHFNDPINPNLATDTTYAFEAGFYNPIFNATGSIIDSFYVVPSTNMILSYHNWYDVFDVIENYELARVITPYGSGLSNNWEFTSTFDITDFVQILRDSVEIRCHYSGWSSGFSATLDFEFIEGTPPRDVVKVKNIYSGNYQYVNSSDFETNKLTPKKMLIEQNSTTAMVKMTSTGHSFDNNINAAEFNPINYHLKVNGTQTHTQYNWDPNCGENPIYPQGGTWIYDRANWCPGTRAHTYDHEITDYITSGDSVELNIDFDSFTWSPHPGTSCPIQGGVCYNNGLGQTPVYIISSQLFQYKDPNFINSAEIIDIIKPSLKDEHSRKNPICGKPLIKIRNYGKAPLTSLFIEYKVVGGITNMFNWTGNLEYLETEEVELPSLNSWDGSANIFEVTLKNPNGQADDYDANNTMQSKFVLTPVYPESFVLRVTTNAGGTSFISETSWDFYDANDPLNSTVFTSGMLLPNTQYVDTLNFNPGCYKFMMKDSDEDGLSFWANNEGSGMVRFREIGAGFLKVFNADFGTNLIHEFTIEETQNTNLNNKEHWNIFPNPTENIITIEGNSTTVSEIIILDNLGKKVIEIITPPSDFISKVIDLTKLENGIYVVQISNNDSKITKKVVKH